MQRWLRVIQVAQKLPATRETISSKMASKTAWAWQRHLAAIPRSLSARAVGRPPHTTEKVRRAPEARRPLNLQMTFSVFYDKCRPSNSVVSNSSNSSINSSSSNISSSNSSINSSSNNSKKCWQR